MPSPYTTVVQWLGRASLDDLMNLKDELDHELTTRAVRSWHTREDFAEEHGIATTTVNAWVRSGKAERLDTDFGPRFRLAKN